MNQQIRNVDLSKSLFIDIETASQFPKLDVKSELFKVFQWKHRNRDDCSLLPNAEVQKIYKNTAALSSIYGKIICVTFGYLNGEELVVKSFSGEDEKVLLSEAKSVLGKVGYTYVFFNAPFDLPMMRKRCNILGIPFPEHANDSGKKPWGLENNIIDLMKDFRGISYNNDSLEELCLAFGVKTSKGGEVKGNEVSKVYHEGGLEKIVKYCEEDVRATVDLFLKMREV